MTKLVIKLEQPISDTVSFIVEHKGKRIDRVWYRDPINQFKDVDIKTLDFALVGYIMKAMKLGKDVFIKGPVYEQTLNNLVLYQKQVNEWWPKYNIVEVEAAKVVEVKENIKSKYMCSFTNGVDSTFTAINKKDVLGAVLYIAGCDVNLSHTNELDSIRNTILNLLKDTGVELRYIDTNIKNILGDHDRTHACQILSTAWLFSTLYRGYIMSGGSMHPDYPWGDSALLVLCLGNDYFEVYREKYRDRTQKIKRIYKDWPDAYNNLRVCWENTRRSFRANENCCQCMKCIRTLLSFKALGLERPASFKRDVEVKDLKIFKHLKYEHEVFFLSCLCENAKRYGRKDMDIFKEAQNILDEIS
jgi:hypothetical protein